MKKKTLCLWLSESCPIGDQNGVVRNGMTCKQLLNDDPHACYKDNTRYICCDSCRPVLTTQEFSVSLDQQCEYKQGKGSYFCRVSLDYLITL